MTEYKRNIKFQYFRISQEKGEHEKNIFPFSDWAVYIDKSFLLRKTLELKGMRARIDEIKYDNEKDIWGIRFMRLRDTNIPSTVKEGKESTPVELEDDEYIGEDVTMIYDEAHGIAMIQSNRFSLYYNRIEELIDKYNPFEGYHILIRPIADTSKVNFDKKNQSKKITISFANIEREMPPTKSTLSNIINSYHKLNGLAGTVTIGVGRTKKEVEKSFNGRKKKFKEERFLNSAEIKDLINDIYDNKEIISGSKIELKDEDGPNLEIIDLFDNIYHDYLTFILESRSTLGFEQVFNDMIEKYLKRRGTILQTLAFA